MNKDEALDLALEALEYRAHGPVSGEKDLTDRAITAIKQARSAPVQEPVALENVYETIIHWDEGGGKRSRRELARRIVALYTIPPAAQRQWVGLTDEDIEQEFGFIDELLRDCVYRTEAKLKEKNT